MTDHWLEDINLENGQLKEALHMAEQKTIDEAERLQQMEARAIAAETLADAAIHRVTLLLDLAFDAAQAAQESTSLSEEWHESHSDIRTWVETPQLPDLAAARELIEKAKEYDRLLAEYGDPEGPYSLETVILRWRQERDEAQPEADTLRTRLAEETEGKHKLFIWASPSLWYVAIHAKSVKDARELVLSDEFDLGGTDGSCPDRASARRAVTETAPEIFYGKQGVSMFPREESEDLRTRLAESEALVERLKGSLQSLHSQCEEHLPGYAYSEQETANEELLAFTPANALEQYRGEVLEEVAEMYDRDGYRNLAAEIRAMKAPEKGGTR